MKFNKLIRDKIIENWNPKYGKNPKAHTASEAEFYNKLKEKLLEETQEFIRDDSPNEIADIMELINTICDFKGFSKDEIDTLRRKKISRNGAFKKKLILESSEH